MSNNVVIFGTDPITNNRYALQCDADGILATSASVTIGSNVDTKTILYSDLTAGSEKKIAIDSLGAPAKDYLGTSDYTIRQSYDSASSRIKVSTEGVRGTSDTAPNDLIPVNVKPTTNKNSLYTYDDTLNSKVKSDTVITDAIQVAVKNIVETGGSNYDTISPAINPLYVDNNGYITANIISATDIITDQNIRIGFITNINSMAILSTAGSSSGLGDWGMTNGTSLDQDGFNYTNIDPANPSYGSLLWYNNGPYGTIVTFPQQADIQYIALKTFYVILANYEPTNQSYIEMNIYSKYNGGTYDWGTNFTSKWNYIFDTTVSSNDKFIGYGQSYMLYNGDPDKIKNDINVPKRFYKLNEAGCLGTRGDTEIISHIELVFKNEGDDIKHRACVIEGGLYIDLVGLLNYYFTNEMVPYAYNNTSLIASRVNKLQFDNDDNLLCATKITNGINSAEIQQNITSTAVNLNNKYGLVTDSVLYAKDPSGDITMLASDGIGNLNVNVITSGVSIFGDVNVLTMPPVEIALDQSINIGNTVTVQGDINVLTMPPVEIALDQSINIGNTVTVQGDVNVLNPVQVVGDDYSGINNKFPIYVDADGIQRTEIVTSHIESAKYIIETDKTNIILLGDLNEVNLDTRGRPGWYINNQYGSDTFVYWYNSNSISNPPPIAFNKMQAIWFTAYIDKTSILPYILVYTANSFWKYTINQTLYNGETYLFYYGNKAVSLNPSVHPIELTRTLQGGTGNMNDNITFMYINFPATSKAGIVNSGIWNQDLAMIFQTIFDNNRDVTVRNNLSSLTVNTSGDLNVNVSTMPPVQIEPGQFVDIANTVTVQGSINIRDSDGNGLNAVSNIIPQLKTTLYNDIGYSISSTSFNSEYFLNVVDINNKLQYSTYILFNGTAQPYNEYTTPITNPFTYLWRKNAVILWRDNLIRDINGITVYGIGSGGQQVYINTIFPYAVYEISSLTPNGRIGSISVDATKYQAYRFRSLSPTATVAVMYLIST